MHTFSDEWDETTEPNRERIQRSAPYEVSTQSRRTASLRHNRQKPPVNCSSAKRRNKRGWA